MHTAQTFRDPAPYPQIAVCQKNSTYAQMLSKSFAASQGELTAITQYLYQNWIFERSYAPIAKTLRGISIVEMEHLHTLGQFIVLLGGDPKYQAPCQENCFAWSGNMVKYHKDLHAALLHDLELERTAYRSYLARASCIHDHYVSEMLRRIAQDELVHIHIFEELLNELDGSCSC